METKEFLHIITKLNGGVVIDRKVIAFSEQIGDDAKKYLGSTYNLAKDESKYTLELRIKFPEPPEQYINKMKFKK